MNNGSDDLPVIDVATFLEDTETLMHITADRYAVPSTSVAIYRQGAQRALHKLLGVVESAEFDTMPVKEKLALATFFTEGAYGKHESNLAAMALAHKMGSDPGSAADHGKELDLIAERMERKYPEMEGKNGLEAHAGKTANEVLKEEFPVNRPRRNTLSLVETNRKRSS